MLLALAIALLVLASIVFWSILNSMLLHKSTLSRFYDFWIEAEYENLLRDNQRIAASWRDEQRARQEEWKQLSLWRMFLTEVPEPDISRRRKKKD